MLQKTSESGLTPEFICPLVSESQKLLFDADYKCYKTPPGVSAKDSSYFRAAVTHSPTHTHTVPASFVHSYMLSHI